MRRATPTLIALALAVAGVGLVAGCGSQSTPVPPVEAAGPQTHELDWQERYPAQGPGLVFTVRSFTVTRKGWEATIGIRNASGVHWELPEDAESYKRTFGVMTFATGDASELDRLNREGQLPTVRRAETFTPALTTFLAAGQRWSGTIAARGALPAGSFVRVVFGPLSSISKPPKGMRSPVVWITDHAVELTP